MSDTLRKRISATGPKKILACDGGGILGLMSVEILATLEDDLRKQLGRTGHRCYWPTTSTSSAGTDHRRDHRDLRALGMPWTSAARFYVDSGAQMFDKASILERLKSPTTTSRSAKCCRSARRMAPTPRSRSLGCAPSS